MKGFLYKNTPSCMSLVIFMESGKTSLNIFWVTEFHNFFGIAFYSILKYLAHLNFTIFNSEVFKKMLQALPVSVGS